MPEESESAYQPAIDLVAELLEAKDHMPSCFTPPVNEAISCIARDLRTAMEQAVLMSFFMQNIADKDTADRIAACGESFSAEALSSPVRELVEKLLQLVTDQRVSDDDADIVYDDIGMLSPDPQDASAIKLHAPYVLRDDAKQALQVEPQPYAKHTHSLLMRLAEELDGTQSKLGA
ncbi:MAG: hypothetical protein WCX61_05570 [Candidatus Peribacteraceae bacterium]|jgi:hypothetical protein